MICCIFFELIWLGVGFLNRTGAEIGYWLDKKSPQKFLFVKKLKKPNVPSSGSIRRGKKYQQQASPRVHSAQCTHVSRERLKKGKGNARGHFGMKSIHISSPQRLLNLFRLKSSHTDRTYGNGAEKLLPVWISQLGIIWWFVTDYSRPFGGGWGGLPFKDPLMQSWTDKNTQLASSTYKHNLKFSNQL